MVTFHAYASDSPNRGHQCSSEHHLEIHHMYCHTLLLGELSAVHVTLLKENNWKLAPNFSYIVPYVPLSFVDFNLYPFAITNHVLNSFSEYSES